jgi:hypothetical protein
VQRLSGQQAPANATLVGNINSSTTNIVLSSTASLPSAGFIRIDAEDIYYGWINPNNSLGGVFRGQNGTAAASHSTGATIYNPNLPAITVWPTPDNSTTYQFVYWRMRRVQDAGNGIETADMNFRFLPCLTAGLAYYIAMKIPELTERLPILKAAYEEQFMLAAGEDREKAAVRFVPRRQFLGSGA